MIKLAIYHLLLICSLSSLFMGTRWVLFALALLAPLVQTLPGPYGFPLSPVNAVLLGLGGLMIRASPETRPATPAPNIKIMVLWTLVLFAGVMRTVFYPPSDVAYLIDPVEVMLTGWYWTTPLIIYYMIYHLVATRALARQLIAVCMTSMALESTLAMYERLQGTGRATAHLAEPNRAGAYFAGAVVLFFAFVLIQKGKQRLVFVSGWILAVGALFATLSRGGLLAASVGSTVVFAMFFMLSEHKTLGTKLKYVILGGLMLANVVLVMPQRLLDRVLESVGRTQETAEMEAPRPRRRPLPEDSISVESLDKASAGRWSLWRAGFALVATQPSGHGAYTALPLQARFREGGKAMHNIYLQILVEHGVQGLACLLLFIGTVAWNLWRRFRLSRESADDSAMFLGLLGYWIALVVAHFFVNPFFMLQLNGQFWVMSACALRHGPDPRAGE